MVGKPVNAWKPSEYHEHTQRPMERTQKYDELAAAVEWCYEHGVKVEFSKQVEEKYRATLLTLSDGSIIAGYGLLNTVTMAKEHIRKSQELGGKERQTVKVDIQANATQAYEEIAKTKKLIEQTIAAAERLKLSIGEPYAVLSNGFVDVREIVNLYEPYGKKTWCMTVRGVGFSIQITREDADAINEAMVMYFGRANRSEGTR